MEEKVYRQRRNLMITCIGIILFYMGPGDFSKIGALDTLGLKQLEEWKLKAVILVMYLYYAWRYYQYSGEYPAPFMQSIKRYLMNDVGQETNNVFYHTIKDELEKKHRHDPYTTEEITGEVQLGTIDGVFSPWYVYTNTCLKTFKPISENSDLLSVVGQHHQRFSYKVEGGGWRGFKFRTVMRVAIHRTGFTDWVMPWLFFWGTSILIIWNEGPAFAKWIISWLLFFWGYILIAWNGLITTIRELATM